MLRSRALSALLAAAVLLSGCAPAARPPQTEPRPQPSRRPNIVLLLTDDMDMSALASMPTVKKELIDRGTSFSNAFVTDSVCCPSRSSILTGLYVHNHGVLDNKPPNGGYRKFIEGGHEESTVAVWLKAAGYRTGLVGKYLNRYPGQRYRSHVPPGWDEWHAVFFPETYYNYQLSDNGKVTEFGERPEDYLTDVLAARALEFVKGGDATTPFFLYLAPFAPHAPALPAERHESLFPGLKAPRPPSFDEEDMSDKPKWMSGFGRFDADTLEKIDDWHRRRAQTLQAVDEMLAKLVQALEARGQLDDTYIFFSSDNGFELGAHRLDHGKGDAYEESIRVPLVVRGPGVPAGRTLPHMALNIDFTPTFVALGGGTPARPIDGRSLVPLLGARPPAAKEWRSDFLVEHWDSGRARETDNDEADGAVPEYSALRTGENLYVEYPKTGERELYDLRNDPYEMRSIHATAPAELLTRLAARLAALKTCRGDACR